MAAKLAPSHRLPRRHCLRHRGWRAKKICTQKLAITPPPRPRRWQGISHFPFSWGQGDLFPCGVWGSAPQILGENKRRGVRGRAFTTPPRPRRWQGISHFPLSWGQGDLFPCGGWGSAPRALGENKRRGRGDDALVFNSHRQPEEHHAHACTSRTRWAEKGGGCDF